MISTGSLVLAVGLGAVALAVWLRLWARRSPPPVPLGVFAGQLAACPRRPNCVSSDSLEPRHAMPPVRFLGSADEAVERLVIILRRMPRIELITASGRYLHAEASSRLFGFVDDIEFLVDEAQHVIRFRSAARSGYSDLGVNRRRMERIVWAMQEQQANDSSRSSDCQFGGA